MTTYNRTNQYVLSSVDPRVEGPVIKHDQEVSELLIRDRIIYQILLHESKDHAVVEHAHHP